ncbi:MAG: 6,7-dimethyl-8-ribityllumazine synthase [Candidatus Melainabacteria bacterium]|nr:6,7-dimethyl-8-ribityllumazine synthase [Candidatus Melainabacteria bacterium]
MVNTLETRFHGTNARVAIVVSRFNELITERLLNGALKTLQHCGVSPESITVAWVPGAFEIPLVAKKFAQSGRYEAVVALGCIIQGSTDHYDYVCSGVTSGIQSASLETGIPILFGVLTTQTLEQAFERAGAKAGNKGSEAALTALEMIHLLREIAQP